MRAPSAFVICHLAFVISAAAADWPPALDADNPVTESADGRTIERFIHGPREEWGYPASAKDEWATPPPRETTPQQQNHNSFYVVTPKSPRDQTPLCVVLHSANRTAYDYLGFDCLERKLPERGDFHTVMTKSPPEFYALFLSSTNAEWWGWNQIRGHVKTPGFISPAEHRILDTIEWVVNRYHIDRNRIYLCGVSMGGCGTLGLGMPHGDIFAAIRAMVPAGTEYAAYRMSGVQPASGPDAPAAERDAWLQAVASPGLPDPPVIEDFSAQNDNWSKTQPALVQVAEAARLPLMLTWGLFGHATYGNLVAEYAPCEVGLAFPWLEIRRNEAYPVLAHASCDQHSPWSNAPEGFDEAGQMNAWFRWKNIRDTPASFAMQIWLAQPKTIHPITAPETATADITLRRLQQFKPQPGVAYRWQWTRDGKSLASGRISPDAARLLTIPGATITTAPVELSIEPAR
jgi:predicted esterase